MGLRLFWALVPLFALSFNANSKFDHDDTATDQALRIDGQIPLWWNSPNSKTPEGMFSLMAKADRDGTLSDVQRCGPRGCVKPNRQIREQAIDLVEEVSGQVLFTVTPQVIGTILTRHGIEHQTVLDADGDPMIRGTNDSQSWTGMFVVFWDCNNSGCQRFRLNAWHTLGHTIHHDFTNEFNEQIMWVRGYVDQDGDFMIEMDVNVGQGLGFEGLEYLFSQFIVGNDVAATALETYVTASAEE